ncbi:hypothetical protein HDA40_004773 [Hamadaea flava]|uniref:Uncharacterized protein n=1 Tax=Hamadaea flava TaxID=1742688 RepID=A0ABV8LF45_9ACTN|nr:hypothetical protein [Hamadaea flava]MCP2326266.1 hypothetical protein [Hamadaea flava]
MTVRGIAIDLQAVTDLFTKLSSDVDVGLVPDGERAALGVGCGARFGTGFAALDVQGHVKASNVAFTLASTRYVDNLKSHLANARGLMASVEKVLTNYRSVDKVAAVLATSAMTRSAEFSDESTSSNTGIVGTGVATTLPQPPLPRAPEFASVDVAWGTAYDVQRMKDILFRDDIKESWNQVGALRLLGQALENHYRRFLELRPKLAEVWPVDGSPTAAEAQARIDEHARAVWQDAICAQTTAKALDGIVAAIAKAREKMLPLHERWQTVTTDFMPEAFDHAAQELNVRGREVMKELDATVGDLRTQIYFPETTRQVKGELDEPPEETFDPRRSGPEPSPDSEDVGGSRQSLQRPVPPIPGVPPGDGPVLSGGVPPVGISPSTPPSTLPVPPGVMSEAPYGGAWVLPGPATSTFRQNLPVGGVVAASPAVGFRNRASVAGTAGSSGMMSVPVGGYGGGAAASEGSGRQKMATEQWEVAEGVPPVIGEAGPFFEEEKEPDDEQRMRQEFEDWYNRTMLPWTEGLNL